jgi:hypothetical protein
MNAPHLLLWTGLLTLVLGAAPLSQDQQEKPKEKKKGNAVTRFFDDQSTELMKEVEGAWALFEYTNPNEREVGDQASGFATFHDGFLTLVLALDTAHQTILGPREFLVFDSALFRYRFDEQANLQLASVMGYTNQTGDSEMSREPTGRVVEYYARLDDGALELRDPDGIVFSFHKITAGDFPDAAIRKLERRGSGTAQWEDSGGH